MSKSKKMAHAGVQFRPAPQVVSMAGAAVGRLEKLLTLCDLQLNAMMKKADTPNALPTREILTLGRMILNLQKDLEKYAAIIYPAIELPSPASVNSDLAGEPVIITETREAGNTAPSEAADNQDFETLLQVGGLLAESMSAQTSQMKKRKKEQKFSHAFFQKRPQTATL